MKKIKLTQNQIAIVCDCHAHLVENKKWCAQWSSHTQSFYAARRATAVERLLGAPERILMHIVINNTPKGMQTDHRDTDTLNNQCSNLRNATHAQNMSNQTKRKHNKSGFKGVSYHKRDGRWHAKIGLNGKDKRLGSFDNPEQAAHAYNSAAQELRGEFARLNEVP